MKQLSTEEQKVISNKITELTRLNQLAISIDAKALLYDWSELDKHLKQSILDYRHILNTNEVI